MACVVSVGTTVLKGRVPLAIPHAAASSRAIRTEWTGASMAPASTCPDTLGYTASSALVGLMTS